MRGRGDCPSPSVSTAPGLVPAVPWLYARPPRNQGFLDDELVGPGQHHAGHEAAYVGEEGDVAVNNLCLDDYIAKNKIERIPLAKIDIEGFELHAMRGMRDSMEKGLVEAVILEIAPPWLNRQGHRPADIFEFLADTGYRCFFFRSDDSNRSSESARVEVHGTVLHVYPVEHALIEGQTDIIAFHESIYSNRITDHASG